MSATENRWEHSGTQKECRKKPCQSLFGCGLLIVQVIARTSRGPRGSTHFFLQKECRKKWFLHAPLGRTQKGQSVAVRPRFDQLPDTWTAPSQGLDHLPVGGKNWTSTEQRWQGRAGPQTRGSCGAGRGPGLVSRTRGRQARARKGGASPSTEAADASPPACRQARPWVRQCRGSKGMLVPAVGGRAPAAAGRSSSGGRTLPGRMEQWRQKHE